MTLDRLIAALVRSDNDAADDTLLEALRLGNDTERATVINALLRRKKMRGLTGLIEQFTSLPEPLQAEVLEQINVLHHALREAGRSDKPVRRLAAMQLIAIARQGSLAYVLGENLHEPDERVSKAAAAALVAMARWASVETRALQRGKAEDEGGSLGPNDQYKLLIAQRADIEQAVGRAIDSHRGRYGQDLLRAALLLCDSAGSKTFEILKSTKHGGQGAMVRRLQQPPAAEHVEAFLLAAAHGSVRSHFAVAFAHIEEAPVLDALMRRTYWLHDNGLRTAVHAISRGTWLGEDELSHDLDRRRPEDAALIGPWIAASGAPDDIQDARLDRLRLHAGDQLVARISLLRLAIARKRGGSTALLKQFLNDPDERLARIATRDLIRRKPPDLENTLLQLMTSATPGIRAIVGRVIGQSGFDQYWQRFDRLDPATRRSAGKAMLKLLPDAHQRLTRRLAAGPVEARVKAMQIVHELELTQSMAESVVDLCEDPNPKLRSKAVSMLVDIPAVAPDALIERLLADTDARVRANSIEILEKRFKAQWVPTLVQRARAGTNRERGNALKVLHRLKASSFSASLTAMMRDPRPEHRISALWVLKKTGFWGLIGDVGQMAKVDPDAKTRRYALGVLKNVSETMREQKAKVA